MIVKDESEIIQRCLQSVVGHIDYWFIADTGSSDKTREEALTVLSGIPGEYFSVPWTDFSDARNNLLDHARKHADYFLWLDADETLELDSSTHWSDLTLSAYLVDVEAQDGVRQQCRLIASDGTHRFLGKVSETINDSQTLSRLGGVSIRHHEDGIRQRSPLTRQDDIEIIKQELRVDPHNPSRTLALADAYAAEGDVLAALIQFRKLAELSEEDSLVWYALYQAARMQDTLDSNPQSTVAAYLEAYDSLPGKIEPLIHISRMCRQAGQLQTARDIIETAIDTDPIDHDYFYEPAAWSTQRWLEYLRVCIAMGDSDQTDKLVTQLLASDAVSSRDQSIAAALQHERHYFKSNEAKSVDTAIDDPAINTVSSETKRAPEPTPPGEKRKLCIGMATYDDYDGVYFSVQAIRMYHPEILDQIEILVVDNNPTGPAAVRLKELETLIPNYRYVPEQDTVGTMIRDRIFQEANSDYVLVMDCHVFIVPGAIQKLLEYLDSCPNTSDFLQGPLLHDDFKTLLTHFSPQWQEGMWGTWGTDPRGELADAEPFDIPMQGLGVFACRRAAWPGFNPDFRGFGGEEGYIHEKVRQGGGRTLCLPFLRWVHRFHRPLGVPYPVNWESRIRNYIIGWEELGLATDSIRSHFKEKLPEHEVDKIFEQVALERAQK